MTTSLAPRRVLPTLNADGSRVRMRPRPYEGAWLRRRRGVAWGLMALFVALPFCRVAERPALLLDVAHREFTIGGHVFLATEGALLMLLLLAIFVAIIGTTAVLGRAWCGWGCPQTVYLEFLFRPIERLFEGKREQQLRLDREGGGLRRLAKNAAFVALSVLLGNLFLSYFVGVEQLRTWISSSPFQHPAGFLVMAVTSGLVFIDFAYFREQMCTVACPYARIQSVLLDTRSLLVGYDSRRGEPRSKGKPKANHGDCIDCQACVVACPTGIDIRHGLQLECIACTQCIDACDSIMRRIGRPPGLIRYASQRELEGGEPGRVLRPRVVIYALVFLTLVSGLAWFSAHERAADVTVLRGLGAPFTENGGQVINQIRIKIQNRERAARHFEISLAPLPGGELIAPENPLLVPAGEQRETSVFVTLPAERFEGGKHRVSFRVRDGAAHEYVSEYPLLGPSKKERP